MELRFFSLWSNTAIFITRLEKSSFFVCFSLSVSLVVYRLSSVSQYKVILVVLICFVSF